MKQGKSITELALELQNIRNHQKDFIIPNEAMGKVKAVTLEDVISETESHREIGLAIVNGETKSFKPTKFANSQIAGFADIPKPYFDRINRENPVLLTSAINHGFAMSTTLALANRQPGGRMLRTYDGKLRALVSSRYRRLDNFDPFEAVAPALLELGFEPESQELTEERLYIKCVTPKVTADVKPGDTVQYGLVVSNSDVGAGSVRVEPIIYRLVCKNGMISNVARRHAHLGRNQAGEGIEELLSDSTKELNDRAFWNTIRDVVTNFAKPEFFEAEVNKLREAARQPIVNFNLPQIVEESARQIGFALSDKAKGSIVDAMASGADGAGMNKWGLANAWTQGAQAEDLEYEAATEMERAGSKIIELTARQWEYVNAK